MRINLVEPSELMDQHLIAEYREIRLLSASLKRTLNSKDGFVESKVPKKFTLMTGHAYFFFNKGMYIHKRYESLQKEMEKRGISAKLEFPLEKWPDFLYNDWEPSEEDKNLVRERIRFRISQKPEWYRYYGKYIYRGE